MQCNAMQCNAMQCNKCSKMRSSHCFVKFQCCNALLYNQRKQYDATKSTKIKSFSGLKLGAVLCDKSLQIPAQISDRFWLPQRKKYKSCLKSVQLSAQISMHCSAWLHGCAPSRQRLNLISWTKHYDPAEDTPGTNKGEVKDVEELWVLFRPRFSRRGELVEVVVIFRGRKGWQKWSIVR